MVDKVNTSSVGLKKLAVRGAAWTIVGFGFSQGLRLGSNLILTRLLVPEMFGLMSLIYVFITGLELFSDIGIRPSIIQSQRGDDQTFLNTAWTLQVIRGFCLWFGCLLIAWPIATVYDEPRLRWLLPIVGVTSIINGFNSTSLATLSRRLEVGKLTRFEFITRSLSVVILIVWAWFKPSIWALVGGKLVSDLLIMLWSHRLLPEVSNRFTLNKEAARQLFTFGRWILITTACGFLFRQADRLILGKFFSLEMLGVYTIAYTFADLPRKVSERIGSHVIFPVISQQNHLPREILRKKILHKRIIILLAAAFGLTFMVSFGDFIILVLYDDRYSQAVWMMPLLALGLWHTILYNTMEPSLVAIGKPIYKAQGNFFSFLLLVIGLPLGFTFAGILGAVLVASFSDLPKYIVVVHGVCREQLNCLKQDIQISMLFFGLLFLVLMSRALLGYGLPISKIL